MCIRDRVSTQSTGTFVVTAMGGDPPDDWEMLEWERRLTHFVQLSRESRIQFEPLTAHLRQALEWLGGSYRLRFELLPSVYGATKLGSALCRTCSSCVPNPRLTDLALAPSQSGARSHWPTTRVESRELAHDPRHQKGTSTCLLYTSPSPRDS
eukprot:TRINITY_DN25957_c0_g1_i13.p1 TRINITY_DN25957_c0_g1~~TRINITY_DN25957_c0_g1_i13.p1  ORF type:complete len:153 (-),score=22.37 TRINITY_DN25957_c0_g1_i13:94-552(-)